MADPKDTAAELAQELASLYGPRLSIALLYGSVARGEAIAGVSDINVLVLLDRVDPPALRLASSLARRWTRAGNTAPLLMSWSEWRGAADSFAIELADMRDAHLVLRGTDPLAGDPNDLRAMRLQAERELRGKLVQLRTGLLLSADRPEEIGRLLETALPSFATYLRAALRLAGRAAPLRTEEVIDQAASVVGFDPKPFLRVSEARRRKETLRAPADEALSTGYYDAALRTTEYVNSLSEAKHA
jgi:hypothetical protein